MYKVFFNDRTIYLDDELPDMSKIQKDYVCAFENITDLKPQIKQFLEPEGKGDLYIFHDDKDSLFHTFSGCFRWIDAAGGLVRNRQGEWLVIFRRGRWDLPKGKAEKGESPEETALREVSEESSLHGLKITGFLHSTYHVYSMDDRFALKKTSWYEMQYGGKDKPVPLESESISRIKWVKTTGLEEIFANTYPSIKEVINKALSKS